MSRAGVQRVLGDRYRVLDALGSGGMGRVYLAQDVVLERRVAIKVLTRAGERFQRTGDAPLGASVVSEARAMAGLSNRHICRVHEVVLDAPQPFIVMEWIEGITLRAAAEGATLRQRIDLFAQVLEGAAALHRAGLVHRDLKPGNILIDRHGCAVIVDFGLAMSRNSSEAGLGSGGTPGYAAPEQFVPGAPVGPSADVFALGIILFELLTGSRPFTGASTDDLLELMKSADPPLPQDLAPETPAPLQRICLLAIDRFSRNRYASAQLFAQDFARYLRGEHVVARPRVLMSTFGEQVDSHLSRVQLWKRQGLITRTEETRLRRAIEPLTLPESAWTLDARRLSPSQIAIYIGGWLVLLAFTLGLWRTWSDLGPWLRVGAPCSVSVSLLALGAWLRTRQRHRFALAYLFIACVTVPICTWLVLKQSGWLRTTDPSPHGSGELATLLLLRDPPLISPGKFVDGLSNDQIMAIGIAWVSVAAAMRVLLKSGAFTLLMCVSGAILWASLWLRFGLLQEPGEITAGGFGGWMAVLGGATLALGLGLSVREARGGRPGGTRAPARDSHPVLVSATITLTLGLTVAALFASIRYPLSSLLSEEATTRTLAVALAWNGVVLYIASVLLARGRSVVRQRLAEGLRWVIPSHWLGAILLMEYDSSGRAVWYWVAALAIASFVMCFLSAWRQWKPFLATGLGYLAIAYSESLRHAENAEAPLRIGLTVSAAAIGVAALLLAWFGPSIRLPRMRRLEADAVQPGDGTRTRHRVDEASVDD